MHNPEDRSFLGHPRGLGFIAFAEAWERFSYCGMQTLLVLYMSKRLLLPGHIEHVAGFEPFRHLLEGIYATNFWLLHSALCGTAGIIFFVAGRFFGHLLAPGDSERPECVA